MERKYNLPQVLYKYVPYNDYSQCNLKNAQIYFNRPVDFNDPFDCSLIVESIKNDDESIMQFHNAWVSGKLRGFPTPEPHLLKIIDSIANIPDDFIRLVEKSTIAFAKEKHQENQFKTGCACFSEINDSLLMWSHYADGHKGFCLEFDASFAPFNKAFKVEYSDSFPSIDFISILLEGKKFDRRALISLLTKYTCWEYEKEWRILNRKSKSFYPYKVDALKAVYFGASIEKSNIENIYLILQRQNSDVAFYKAKRSSKKYEIKFDLYTDTPAQKSIKLPDN